MSFALALYSFTSSRLQLWTLLSKVVAQSLAELLAEGNTPAIVPVNVLQLRSRFASS